MNFASNSKMLVELALTVMIVELALTVMIVNGGKDSTCLPGSFDHCTSICIL